MKVIILGIGALLNAFAMEAKSFAAPVEGWAELIPGHVYTLTSLYSNKCLDVRANGLNNGASLQQWQCMEGNQQRFRLMDEGGGYFSLMGLQSGKCVSAEAVSLANGTTVLQWECHSGPDQKVRMAKSAFGAYTVHFSHSDKCMDVKGTTSDDGVGIIQFECTGKSDQDWIFKDITATLPDWETGTPDDWTGGNNPPDDWTGGETSGGSGTDWTADSF